MNVVKDLNTLYDHMGAVMDAVDSVFSSCFNARLSLTKRFICDAGIPLAAYELRVFRELLERPTSVSVDPSIWDCDEEQIE